MKTGPQLKSLIQQAGGAGDQTQGPWVQGEWFIHSKRGYIVLIKMNKVVALLNFSSNNCRSEWATLNIYTQCQ